MWYECLFQIVVNLIFLKQNDVSIKNFIETENERSF